MINKIVMQKTEKTIKIEGREVYEFQKRNQKAYDRYRFFRC